MSFFRQTLEQEISAVFLNLDEFAEELEIDGVIRKALIDDSAQGFSTAVKGDFSNPSGLSLIEGSRLLYVEDNFEKRPVPGQTLTINDELWQVDDSLGSVKIEMGILVIKLNRVSN